MNFDRIKTDTWSLCIPEDWLDKTEDNSSVYFESPDQAKGCYVTTLIFDELRTDDMQQRMVSGKEIKIRSLQRIEGGTWACVSNVEIACGFDLVAVIDHLNDDRKYRIVDKVIVTPQATIFLSCHDYCCENYEQSKEFFSYMVDSFHSETTSS
jgi:hypothetical protein